MMLEKPLQGSSVYTDGYLEIMVIRDAIEKAVKRRKLDFKPFGTARDQKTILTKMIKAEKLMNDCMRFETEMRSNK